MMPLSDRHARILALIQDRPRLLGELLSELPYNDSTICKDLQVLRWRGLIYSVLVRAGRKSQNMWFSGAQDAAREPVLPWMGNKPVLPIGVRGRLVEERHPTRCAPRRRGVPYGQSPLGWVL